jgi:rare lipoprotein A
MIFAGYVIAIFALSFVVSCASTRFETYQEPRAAVASWYGAEFHGRPTASGEKFDMNSLTCAHRELPFGTLLQVTNISNGKAVRCIVNDRGPFVSGRDIDLSYAAAREIGLIGSGTAPVRIAYAGRDPNYIREVKYAATNGPFTIQIGSFTERDNAVRLKTGLDLKYEGVYIIEALVKNTLYYRVKIGKFQRKEEAFTRAKVMADEGYSPWIVHYDERA